jgi:hypothetical protein
MKHIKLFESFDSEGSPRIKSLSELESFGYYDADQKIFHLEIGSDAYNDYMAEFFPDYLENETASDLGYQKWYSDVDAAVKHFYGPESRTELY